MDWLKDVGVELLSVVASKSKTVFGFTIPDLNRVRIGWGGGGSVVEIRGSCCCGRCKEPMGEGEWEVGVMVG